MLICVFTASVTEPDPIDAIASSHWSKESLFALLGVLTVVLVPCVGILLKTWLARRRAPRFRRRDLNGMRSYRMLMRELILIR